MQPKEKKKKKKEKKKAWNKKTHPSKHSNNSNNGWLGIILQRRRMGLSFALRSLHRGKGASKRVQRMWCMQGWGDDPSPQLMSVPGPTWLCLGFRRLPPAGDFSEVGAWGRELIFLSFSKEKVGFLTWKDNDTDHLVSLLSWKYSPHLETKIRERSVHGHRNQSPLLTRKSPPFSSCTWPSLKLTYLSCKYVY